MIIGNAILMTMFSGQVDIIIGRGDIHNFYIVEGALEPDLLVVLQDEKGNLKDLSSATGTISMRDSRGNLLINALALSISGVDAANGEIKYPWASPDTDVPGIHRAELVVDLGGGAGNQPIYEIVEVHIRPKLAS